MVKVTIDSIRVSLMSQYRVVILKDDTGDRYLPIWIGPPEADAITVELQNMEYSRPLTHDLLNAVIANMGGEVRRIEIHNLEEDVFFANIMIDLNGEEIAVDARPSDSIALAVRADVPIFVAQDVMDAASITPDENVELSSKPPETQADDEKLSLFKDFLDSLDMDDLEDQ